MRLTLIGNSVCHLCMEARHSVTAVIAELSQSPPTSFHAPPRIIFEELSIADDPNLFETYWEKIPVLLINGTLHSFWRVDPAALKNSIKALVENE